MGKSSGQLNILAILTESIGGRLTTSSILDGFRALGHKVVVYDKLSDTNSVSLEENYDFVFGYDYAGIEFSVKNNLDVVNVNYFSDVIDDNHSGNYWKQYYKYLLSEKSYTFYWDKVLCEQKQKEIKNLFYLPHFVNTEIYRNTNSEKVYDVMFAGRLDSDYRLNTFVDILKSCPEYRFGWFAFEKHFDDAVSRVGDEDKPLIEQVYCGFIDNENDMSKALNDSKVIINFNEQGVSSLNYRTIQAMACECLVLSDYRSEGVEFFKDDFVYYNDTKDLKDKVKLYLEAPKLYEEKTKNVRKIIEKDFSHVAGAQKIIDKIR